MAKPFDVSKFRKEITKSIDGLSIGFNDPTDWISTGNYALNYLMKNGINHFRTFIASKILALPILNRVNSG